MLPYPLAVRGAVFVSARRGLAITESTILATADSGKTWKRLMAGVDMVFVSLGAHDRRHLWISGGVVTECSPACRGFLLRTDDGGRSWVLIRLPHAVGYSGFSWVTPQRGFVNDGGYIYRTEDSGRIWFPASLVGG